MNPFDLRGPEFLLFYLLLSLVMVGLAWFLRNQREAGPAPHLSLDDPYFFAYLRGGGTEAFRAAIVVLLDRGLLLNADGATVQRAAAVEPRAAEHPVEREALGYFATPHVAYDALQPGVLGTSTNAYDANAQQHGLTPNSGQQAQRQLIYVIAAAVLAVVALIKLFVALARGRTNVGFLIMLGIVAQYLLFKVAFPRLTARGRALIRNVQTLFGDLEGRRPMLRPAAGTKELAWLVGVFGVASLPLGFPDVNVLFPKSTGSYGFSSSCGTTCGAASGCGSGCGGGSCGGGCGGCGS